ncbi:MAG: hypothetical protein H0V29_00055 [Thermoleophilaceae bacterium]|nr:hypothetical protein [Thermoleophilaceae bacterium]
MKKMIIWAAITALAIPASAMAADQNGAQNPSKQCKALKAAMGAENFANTYGTNANKRNAFGKCVSAVARQQGKVEQQAKSNASKDCKAEQADPNFAATHGGKTFEQLYGTNKNGNNAFGKCVSQKASANAKADPTAKNQVNAAKQCKADKKADAAKFAADYGSRPNAFGKCVSKKAKAQQDS